MEFVLIVVSVQLSTFHTEGKVYTYPEETQPKFWKSLKSRDANVAFICI